VSIGLAGNPPGPAPLPISQEMLSALAAVLLTTQISTIQPSPLTIKSCRYFGRRAIRRHRQVGCDGGYYHYDQNNFGAGASCNTAAKATCSGTFDAVSFAVDWRFAAKFDAYAGLMFSQVNNGLANVYLNRNTIDPTVALRFRF
jgi:hypothetical protein